MRNFKRLISFILVFSMLLSFIPTAYAENVFMNSKGQFVELDSSKHSDLDAVELAFEHGNNKHKVFDFSKYSHVQNNLNDAIKNRRNSSLSDEDKEYVENIAAAFATPVGAIDIDGNPNDKIDIIVWLQQIPTALKEAYGEFSTMRFVEEYEVLGAQAREAIKQQFRGKSFSKNSDRFSSAIKFEYSTVFSGFAMKVTVKEARAIAEMPGVYAVNPDTLMYANSASYYDPSYDYTGMLESREAFDMADIHAAGITGEGVVVGVLDTGIDYNHPDLADVYKGGYNYILPEADYGRPEELRYDPMETTYIQWQNSGKPEQNANGSDYYTDHGTHVSGTIASRPMNNASATYKSLGMAPDVDLYVARVLGPYGSGATAGIIAAVEDFAAGNVEKGIPKADVINLSLGSDNNTAYGENVFALNNAVLAGVNVAVSAGNAAAGNGSSMSDRKIKTLGTPGTAYLPVTVAASQYGGQHQKSYDTVTAVISSATSGSAIDAMNIGSIQSATTSAAIFGLLVEGQDPSNTFADNSVTGTPAPEYVPDKGYEVYLAFGPDDTNPTLEQLQAIPDGSLAGKILVVKRGLNFTDFHAQALRTGAGALIIVNNATNGEAYITNMAIGGTKTGSLPIFSAFHSTSQKLTDLAENNETVYLQLGALTKQEQLKYPAYFSSIGPVNPVIGLKPDIIAPGWQIVSTAPAYITAADHDADDYSAAYQSMGGTSMSSPHIAGILALMKQKYPDAEPSEIKARLMNTAKYDNFIKTSDTVNEYNASVLEIGAGFVDPYRAIMEEGTKNVYVTATDDIPGRSQGDIIEDMTLSSLSFGILVDETASRQIPVKVHGAASFDIDVVYNNNTRYSNDGGTDVTLEYGNVQDGTFNVWIEASQNAENGYYEGWLKITANGTVYTMPWFVQVGEEVLPEFSNLIFTAERPIISTSLDDNVRSVGGASPLNPNNTTLYFAWEGAWPTDSKGYSDLDFFLVKPENITDESVIPDYYVGYVTIGNMENDGGMYFLSNFIKGNEVYKCDENGEVINEQTTVANGVYNLAVLAGDIFYTIPEVGVVMTDGTGDYEVQLTMDGEIYVNPDPSVTEARVTGKVFSPALKKAADAGFLWTEATDFWYYGKAFAIDQSFNVLGYADAPVALIGSDAHNIVLNNEEFWLCDENGNFSFTVPVTDEEKNGGYVFDLGGNHAIVGVEGFHYNDNYSAWPMIGANKSASVAPIYANQRTVADGEGGTYAPPASTPAPTPTPDSTEEDGAVTVPESMIDINVNDGNAEITIDKDVANSIENGNSDSLSINIDEISDVDGISLVIPNEITSALAENNMSITYNYGNIITFDIQVNNSGELVINHKSNESINDGNYTSTDLNFDIDITDNGNNVDNTNNTVRVIVNVAGLEDKSKAGVYTLDEDGNPEYVMTYLNGDVISFYPPHFSPYSVMVMNKTFDDIIGHWAQRDIEDMASKQIVKGKTEDSFAPNDVITRAEFITMVVRALDMKGEGVSKISNSDSDKWYANYLSLAIDAGLIDYTEVEGVAYNAQAVITRAEMAEIIAKAYAILNGEAVEFTGNLKFTDIQANSNDAMYIGYANEKGLIDGFPGDLFKALDNTTRAQAVKVLHRLINK